MKRTILSIAAVLIPVGVDAAACFMVFFTQIDDVLALQTVLAAMPLMLAALVVTGCLPRQPQTALLLSLAALVAYSLLHFAAWIGLTGPALMLAALVPLMIFAAEIFLIHFIREKIEERRTEKMFENQ